MNRYKSAWGITTLILVGTFFWAGCSSGSQAPESAAVSTPVPPPEPEGDLKEEHYPNGQLKESGRWVWNETGTKQLEVGVHKHWHENGQLEGEYSYNRGVKHGFTRRWHDNGQLAYECNFINGEPDLKTAKIRGYHGEDLGF